MKMKAVKANIVKSLNHGAWVPAADNSGAKMLKITSVLRHKTVKGRYPAAGIGDMVTAAVVKGKPDIRKQVVFAVVVRQRKEYRRNNGERIKFDDNALVVCQDKQGNPK